MTTYDEAVALKGDMVNLAPPGAIWRTTIAANPTDAVNFLNRAPAQGAGEAFVSNRADGQVDVYYFS